MNKNDKAENFKQWASTKAQIAFRLSPELKAEIDTHIKETNEPLAKFIIRAIKEQMERDKKGRS